MNIRNKMVNKIKIRYKIKKNKMKIIKKVVIIIIIIIKICKINKIKRKNDIF